jgi:hypothetical protein
VPGSSLAQDTGCHQFFVAFLRHSRQILEMGQDRFLPYVFIPRQLINTGLGIKCPVDTVSLNKLKVFIESYF